MLLLLPFVLFIYTPSLPLPWFRFPAPPLSVPMPVYCLQDCHYFFRSALRLLNISTNISPLYA